MITKDNRFDGLLTEAGKNMLSGRYLLPGESFQDLFARVANHYGSDEGHAQRLYNYMARHWFMPATPILSNGGTDRGLPISCYLNEAGDDMKSIVDAWTETTWLASKGGGVGSYWGQVRSIGEKVGRVGKTSGVVPFMKVQDSLTLAVSQGSLRRGSSAIYLDIWHPEIEEFIEIRRPTGGDINRKCLNIHNAVVVDDEFMYAVAMDNEYKLRSPKDNSVVRTVSARNLWVRLLTARLETGEPYILFRDNVNQTIPNWHKKQGLLVKTSNLCSEITLPTSEERTAVCCLSSLNLETYDEWRDNREFVQDVITFLDNVLEDFIVRAPATHAKAVYSARMERSIGLGVMGFHSYLQKHLVPFGSEEARKINETIFAEIQKHCIAADQLLAEERGPCPDAAAAGYKARFSNITAIAPTASISTICGGASPGIEPFVSNAFVHKTLDGSHTIRNRYLQQYLAAQGKDTPEVWSSIITNEGSVQHLDFLPQNIKEVFKTAYELDQMSIVQLAAERQPFIDQAQSVNLFLPSTVSKQLLHRLHYTAWVRGLKSLYYVRSRSVGRAEVVAQKVRRDVIEECEACQ